MVFSHRGLQSLMGPGRRHRHRGASSVATLCPVQSLGPINTSHSLRDGGGGPRPSGAWDPPRPRASGRGSRLHVPLHVQRQVVGAREGAVAEVALERPVARVLAVVAREFVRARELPAAAVPVAVVGLLACREGAERASVPSQ